MRTLTSIQSADIILADFSLSITATDASTTWVFSADNIVDIGQISWEIPYGGGLGKTSNYNITLSSSSDFIKNNLKNLIRAETNLQVLVNSDFFYPHVGRVRQLTRFGQDPNLFQLEIFDRFLDTVPVFPSSLQDSYSTLHPETLNANIGYPVYYGKHHRPIFHTAVDCRINALIGPQGVSSENHVSSCFFILDRQLSLTSSNSVLMNKTWAQESGSTNSITGGTLFEIKDFEYTASKTFAWTGIANETTKAFPNTINNFNQSRVRLYVGKTTTVQEANPLFTNKKRLLNVTGITIQASWATGTIVPNGSTFMGLRAFGGLTGFTSVGSYVYTTSNGFFIQGSVGTAGLTGNPNVLSMFDADIADGCGISATLVHSPAAQVSSDCIISVLLSGNLYPDEYKNFSVYTPVVNSSDIAVSENPMHILSHVFSEYTSTPFVLSQNSQAQYDVNSYKFQCGFYYREKLSDIIDDFGKTTATNMWIGDSGQLNFRTYQESATATNSGLINATITTSDILNFNIRDNPLGTSQFNSEKARRLRVSYDYSFPAQRYYSTKEANPTNNAYCNSASVAGVENEISRQSRHILSTAVASYYLGNLTRFFTQDESVIDLDLPAKFYQLEVADVLKVQHPSIIGSESLYQVTKSNIDLVRGVIKLQATELLNGG